jgi:hypothetical protein
MMNVSANLVGLSLSNGALPTTGPTLSGWTDVIGFDFSHTTRALSNRHAYVGTDPGYTSFDQYFVDGWRVLFFFYVGGNDCYMLVAR